MDLLEYYVNEIARASDFQNSLNARVNRMQRHYIDNVLPYVTRAHDMWALAQELYNEICDLTDLLGNNLRYIMYLEECVMQPEVLLDAINPFWYYEDDVGYSSDRENVSPDDAILPNLCSSDEDLSSDDDLSLSDESSGYETDSEVEIDAENILNF
ncbi:unnamed protein product [Hermetia illucens]|uniref:Uncharacterized protein n=1 Tax=Hermetia illucens TaxID=343691 RepID=A0A7R8UAC9_HERIL|nr:unnamed protein product [Hermetia illucens]